MKAKATEAPTEADHAAVVRRLWLDKWEAHEVLFPHRHMTDGRKTPGPPFHRDLVDDFWSPASRSIRMAFRGSAKSTLGEEDLTIAAIYEVYHNILIIGASEARAAERLASVANELANNDFINALWGPQKAAGQPWTQTKLVTTRGVCIQALGRDQDIRGIKYLDYRPEFVFVDDFEDKDNVQTPEGRERTLRWFLTELIPACAPERKIRIRATPMHAESVPMRLYRQDHWPTKFYPIEYLGEAGERQPAWPERFNLDWIARERRTYENLGQLGAWDREYMVKAVSDADLVFKREMFRISGRERSWQATYAMIDPARSAGSGSATTGWAVWSWISNRLVVWAADAQFLLPDEIVALGFDLAERFDLTWLGVELDGLEQFLLQPFRHEMVRRGTYLPLKGVRAPRGKLDFIRGLQPFFNAREVEFAQPLAALEKQLLNFPTGHIDAPNALAYALPMRPALPIHDNFAEHHIVADPDYARDRPLFLAANATGAMTTAVLVQAGDGRLVVLADWVVEGSPGECAHIIYSAASLSSAGTMQASPGPPRAWDDMLKAAVPDTRVTRRAPPVWIVPPHHQEKYTNVGLIAAARQVPAEVRLGGEIVAGNQHLRELLARQNRGLPAVEVGAGAKWTLRALSGGYTRSMTKGRLQDFAEEGPYRLLIEGLESFCAILATGRGLARRDEEEDIETQNWSYDRQGRRYLSAMPARR